VVRLVFHALFSCNLFDAFLSYITTCLGWPAATKAALYGIHVVLLRRCFDV